jgi:hypothetical protein
MDFLFKAGKGYEKLVKLIRSNPRYVFSIFREDKADKRTKKAKLRGWVEVRHKQHAGVIKLVKEEGTCFAHIDDESGGLKLIGAWTSWIASRAGDLVSGLDVRFL